MRRRTVGATAVAAALALTVAACSDDSDDDGNDGESQEFSGELVIWADEIRTPVLEEFTQDFEAQTGVQVTVQEYAEELRETYLTATSQGQGPDIVVGAHDWIGELVSDGAVAPVQLTGEQQAALAPEALSAVTVDGQYYGVPYAMTNLGLLRNADLAPEVPATFEELVDTGQQLVADGEADEAVMTEISADGNAYHGYPLFTSMGGYLFGTGEDGALDPTDIGVDSEGGIAAFEKLYDLGEAGEGVLRTSMTADNARPFFNDGKTPFLISGPWAVSDAEAAGIDVEVSAIPGFADGGPAKPFLEVQSFYVSSQSENALFAQEFVSNYVLDADLALDLYEADPRAPALVEAAEQVRAEDPNMEGFLAAGADAELMPAIPEMASVWEPFGRAMADVLDGSVDGETAATTAADTIRDAIADGE